MSCVDNDQNILLPRTTRTFRQLPRFRLHKMRVCWREMKLDRGCVLLFLLYADSVIALNLSFMQIGLCNCAPMTRRSTFVRPPFN